MLLRRRADTLLLQKTDRCRNNLDCRHVPKYKYLHNHFVNLAHNRIFMTSGKKTRCVSVSETHCALAIATLLTGWTDTQASARYLRYRVAQWQTCHWCGAGGGAADRPRPKEGGASPAAAG